MAYSILVGVHVLAAIIFLAAGSLDTEEVVVYYAYWAGVLTMMALVTIADVAAVVSGRSHEREFDRPAYLMFILIWPIVPLWTALDYLEGPDWSSPFRKDIRNALENFRFIGRSP